MKMQRLAEGTAAACSSSSAAAAANLKKQLQSTESGLVHLKAQVFAASNALSDSESQP